MGFGSVTATTRLSDRLAASIEVNVAPQVGQCRRRQTLFWRFWGRELVTSVLAPQYIHTKDFSPFVGRATGDFGFAKAPRDEKPACGCPIVVHTMSIYCHNAINFASG